MYVCGVAAIQCHASHYEAQQKVLNEALNRKDSVQQAESHEHTFRYSPLNRPSPKTRICFRMSQAGVGIMQLGD